MSAPGETESTRTSYSYDAQLRAAGVSKGASTVAYSYAGDLLDGIATASGTVPRPLTTTGSMAATLGAANPLRYRRALIMSFVFLMVQ